MNNRQITQAYADWCASISPDFYFVLNYKPTQLHRKRGTQKGLSRDMGYDELSQQVRRLFYRLEVDEWGYEQRESRWGRKFSRIERIVCIEKAAAYHANVLMKRYGEHTDEEILKHVRDVWLELQGVNGGWQDEFLFRLEDNAIRDIGAVSLYCNKDTAKANKNNEDVLCTRASFISKHCNRR